MGLPTVSAGRTVSLAPTSALYATSPNPIHKYAAMNVLMPANKKSGLYMQKRTHMKSRGNAPRASIAPRVIRCSADQIEILALNRLLVLSATIPPIAAPPIAKPLHNVSRGSGCMAML